VAGVLAGTVRAYSKNTHEGLSAGQQVS